MIVNSSVIIILSKINRLQLLTDLYNKIIISEAVYRECIAGISSEVEIIKDFVSQGKIKVKVLDKKEIEIYNQFNKLYPQLGMGEKESIALCVAEDKKLILMDEKSARKVCLIYNIRPLGTLRVLLESYKKNLIGESELRNTFKIIINTEFRLGGEVINEFWEVFDKIKKAKRK